MWSGLKKNGEELRPAERLRFIDPSDPEMSIRHQCDLSGISRSWYYKSLEPSRESDANEKLMKLIDCQYMQTPF